MASNNFLNVNMKMTDIRYTEWDMKMLWLTVPKGLLKDEWLVITASHLPLDLW